MQACRQAQAGGWWGGVQLRLWGKQVPALWQVGVRRGEGFGPRRRLAQGAPSSGCSAGLRARLHSRWVTITMPHGITGSFAAVRAFPVWLVTMRLSPAKCACERAKLGGTRWCGARAALPQVPRLQQASRFNDADRKQWGGPDSFGCAGGCRPPAACGDRRLALRAACIAWNGRYTARPAMRRGLGRRASVSPAVLP